jgi:2-methylcitrate dehydratase
VTTVTGVTADPMLAELAEFASGLRYLDLAPEVVHDAKRRIVDTLGCGYGGLDSPPARIAREVADRYRGSRGAAVLGGTGEAAPELAAFANGIMVRALDFNDVNKGHRAGGHPSDVIPAVLAVADAYGMSGKAALSGVVVAYQGYGAIPVHIKKRGWDQGILVATGVAMGVGSMLGLSTRQLANAIALAVTPQVPLAVTRRGELSMWKNCASAATGQNAIFAALLAERGMTGPAQAFTGTHGLVEQATGPFELAVDPGDHGYRVRQSDVKCFPSCGSTQAPLSTLIELADGLDPDEVDAIEVRTHWDTWFETGREPEKWDPRSRETADHSLPYVMAVALRDGTVTPASFSAEAIADPSLRDVMRRITVTEDPALTALRPAETLSDIVVTTRSGRTLEARTGVPKGDHRNPLSDAELDRKFRGMAEQVGTPRDCSSVLDALWTLDSAMDTSTVMRQWAELPDRRDQ